VRRPIDVVDAARPDELNLDDRRLVACPNIMSVLCRVREEGTSLGQLALSFRIFRPKPKRKCPDLIFVKPRFDAYKAISRQIRNTSCKLQIIAMRYILIPPRLHSDSRKAQPVVSSKRTVIVIPGAGSVRVDCSNRGAYLQQEFPDLRAALGVIHREGRF
jgi:hypothetical protein